MANGDMLGLLWSFLSKRGTMRLSFRRLIALELAFFLMLHCNAAQGAEFMFRANVEGQILEGKPLAWNAQQFYLLGRDGQLHKFHPKLATDAKKTGSHFAGFSFSEMRSQLQQEFGRQYDVSTTQHYLVVHPRGERSQWADRFEALFIRFQQYFRVREFTLQEPHYPLVAIVFPNESEYMRHAEASGRTMTPGTLGHYDPITNRVLLFDITSSTTGADWSENASTIIHEATHQTAYNVGIHQRFAAAPRWLVEGLATMFEAPGVWNGRADHSQADRVHRARLRDFRNHVATRRQIGTLAELLTSDRWFRSDPIAAYAEAWALTFYLCETQPRLYAAYLAKTATRPLFSDYPPSARLADFVEIFGSDLRTFEAKYLRYMEDLR